MANLLIVDDNPGLREGISSFFEEQGHQSVTAGGVQEAVELIRNRTPDLILSDFVMDDGTGLGLRQQIRQLGLPQDPYFILLTGHPSLDNAREAYYNGIDLYLTKPFQLPALALAVDNALRHRPVSMPEQVTKQAEAYYHDFFLALNPVLPRLLLLLEGRYGGLGPEQTASLGELFENWRKIVWTTAEFQQRLRSPDAGKVERRRWFGPPALKRVLDKLRPDLSAAQLHVEISRETHLPLGLVHPATAEALMEAVVLRLAAFSAPGATLRLDWSTGDGRLKLNLTGDQSHPDLNASLMRHVALLPPVLPLMEEAGVRVFVSNDIGPWVLSFDRVA